MDETENKQPRDMTLHELREETERHLLYAIIDLSGFSANPSEQLLIATNAYKNFKQGKRASDYDDS